MNKWDRIGLWTAYLAAIFIAVFTFFLSKIYSNHTIFIVGITTTPALIATAISIHIGLQSKQNKNSRK